MWITMVSCSVGMVQAPLAYIAHKNMALEYSTWSQTPHVLARDQGVDL